jgi:hypothetical protein
MATLHWVRHTDCGLVRSRQDEEGCAVLRPPQFLLSAFCFPNFGFTEPFIRVILRYFEIFRVILSSPFTIHHFHHVRRGKQFTIPSTPPPALHRPITPSPITVNRGQSRSITVKKEVFMTRNGKIARLPQPSREQINRRLENGEEGKQIAEWLNTLPEVRSLTAAEF